MDKLVACPNCGEEKATVSIGLNVNHGVYHVEYSCLACGYSDDTIKFSVRQSLKELEKGFCPVCGSQDIVCEPSAPYEGDDGTMILDEYICQTCGHSDTDERLQTADEAYWERADSEE